MRSLAVIGSASILALMGTTSPEAAVLCVSPDVGGCFATIQAAVDATADGDTIRIRPKRDGTAYDENVQVATPNLTIQGEGLRMLGRLDQVAPEFANVQNEAVLRPDPALEAILADFPFADQLDEADEWRQAIFDEKKFLTMCPRATIDVCETAGIPDACGFQNADNPSQVDFDLASGFTVTASGVTIQGLTIRQAFDGVRIKEGSDDVTVDGMCFIRNQNAVRACDFPADPLDADCDFGDMLDLPENVTVTTSRVEGSGGDDKDVFIVGDGAEVTYNVLLNTEGVRITGSGFDVSQNAALTATDGCIEVIDAADGGTIEQNVLVFCDDDLGVITARRSDDVEIRHNIIFAGEDDVITYSGGAGGIIEGNWIQGQPDNGIQIPEADFDTGNGPLETTDLDILYNIIRNFSDDGITFSGSSSLIQGNLIERTANALAEETDGADKASQAGIRIVGQEDDFVDGGDDNRILDNIVRFSTNAGIQNGDTAVEDPLDTADRNAYRRNITVQNLASGIRIDSGEDSVVDDNETLDNLGEGINIGPDAVATDVTDNTSTGNRTDICNDAGISTTDGGGNTFTTGGFTTACVVQQTF